MAAERSTVIAVISAKGGVGKSLLASNLAAAFAAAHRARTLLVDLCVGLGYADLLLDLEPANTVADLLPVAVLDPATGQNELQPRHLELAAVPYPHAAGLFLLAAPPMPNAEGADQQLALDSATTPALLSALRGYFSMIVADCAPGLDPVAMAAAGAADFVFVVLTPDAPTLRSTRRMLERFPHDSGPRLGVVVNQYARGAKLTPKDIADGLNRPLAATLPVDQAAVWENVGLGRPCVLDSRRGLGGEIRKLAANIVRSITSPARS